METNKIIILLAELAKSENLHVESQEDEQENSTPSCSEDEPSLLGKLASGLSHIGALGFVGQPPICAGVVGGGVGGGIFESGLSNIGAFDFVAPRFGGTSEGGTSDRAGSGTLWKSVSGFAWNAATKVWQYVTRNYGVAVRVNLLPVNDLLVNLQDPHRERLADKMRKIMIEHSVVDLNALADKIQQDSSLVRQIVLKYLVEYLIEEMSLPVRIPVRDDS